MKFKVGDKVLVTGGKDKGIKSEIIRVIPKTGRVVVKGANQYTKHVKPIQGKAGEKVRLERPLPTAKIAVLNDKGIQDRIAFSVAKDGTKTRIFKKTGASMPEVKREAKK